MVVELLFGQRRLGLRDLGPMAEGKLEQALVAGQLRQLGIEGLGGLVGHRDVPTHDGVEASLGVGQVVLGDELVLARHVEGDPGPDHIDPEAVAQLEALGRDVQQLLHPGDVVV